MERILTVLENTPLAPDTPALPSAVATTVGTPSDSNSAL